MAYGRISSLVVAIIISINLFETGHALPQMDYSYESHIPSGILRPISGTVPVTIRKEPPSGPESRVLRRIRHKVDKSHVRELDYSIQQDLFQDVQIPNGCSDRYGIRDGVIKHILRGTRDVIAAVFQDALDLITYNIDDVPLAPNVVKGVSKFITDILCGGEDAASDFAYYFDDLTVIITRLLLDLLQFNGNIPKGLLNVTELASKLAVTITQDIIKATEKGVIDLASEIESGLGELEEDIFMLVSRVEGVAGGVEKGVSSVVMGVENAVDDILGVFVNDVEGFARKVKNEIGGAINEVRSDVGNAISAVRSDVGDVVGRVGKGVRSVAGGVEQDVSYVFSAVVNDVEGFARKVKNEIGGAISEVRSDVGNVVGRARKGVRSVAAGVGKGVSSVVMGVENAVDDIIGVL